MTRERDGGARRVEVVKEERDDEQKRHTSNDLPTVHHDGTSEDGMKTETRQHEQQKKDVR